MSSHEGEPLPLQPDMFSGKLVDTRSSTQRRVDKEKAMPQPQLMFPQREIAQFGVHARPQMSLSPHTKLALVMEDPRTDEEKERDLQRAAEALTIPLFVPVQSPQPEAVVNVITVQSLHSTVLFEAKHTPRVRASTHRGWRLQQRVG